MFKNMISKLEFFIALRYLKSKNKEKFISVTAIFSLVGIMLGVATLIIVMSVMNGFREDFTNRILGINSHITVLPKYRGLEEYDKAIELIKKDENVKKINPMVEQQVMVISENATTGIIIKGMKGQDLLEKEQIKDNISAFDFNNEFQDNAILLGESLAMKLRVKEGDTIKIIAPEGNSTILGNLPRTKTYKVIGTYSSGMYEYDANIGFIPLDMAQKHFKYDNSVSGIEIYLKDMNILNTSYGKIKTELLKNNYQVNLIDWKQSNAAFIGALNVERNTYESLPLEMGWRLQFEKEVGEDSSLELTADIAYFYDVMDDEDRTDASFKEAPAQVFYSELERDGRSGAYLNLGAKLKLSNGFGTGLSLGAVTGSEIEGFNLSANLTYRF